MSYGVLFALASAAAASAVETAVSGGTFDGRAAPAGASASADGELVHVVFPLESDWTSRTPSGWAQVARGPVRGETAREALARRILALTRT